MEREALKVSGMSCTNCALSIDKFLKEKGLQNTKVNFIGGEVSFDKTNNISLQEIENGIQQLGYTVVNSQAASPKKYYGIFPFKNYLQRFWFCFVFTAPLLLHMLPFVHIHWLMNAYVQLALTIPVYVVGMDYFGRSAIKSLTKGIPNMNVLIALGSTAAFFYSLYGLIIGKPHEFLFFETAATTITLVFLGNYMEDKSVEQTQKELKKLAITQKSKANMIAFDDKHQEQIFEVETKDLRVGDLVLIKTGEQVPMDCKILWGEASVNEAIITGESVPLHKQIKDTLIGGSLVESGTVKAQITAVGEDTVLAHILKLIKQAETEKPPVQQLADKISAIFVPVVVSIALLTLLINYLFFDISFGNSLLRSIAVLVISCPCAMGLATPAAIAVGLGRAAKNGILFKNAKSLEVFKSIQQVVFDKTGTLTTGNFVITAYETSIAEEEFKQIVYSLEKYANHPIGICIAKAWKTNNDIKWQQVLEIKGQGITATDKTGNTFFAGKNKNGATVHNVYVYKNNELIGYLDVQDELREEAKYVIDTLHKKGVTTILLSGDTHEKCTQVATALGITRVIAEQTPQQKLQHIEQLSALAPTAMVGDGINDGPALAKATVGISLSNATQIAMQSAQVILLNNGLRQLPAALGLGKHTYITIKENLFWAFSYNIVAIPVAALGFLSPTIGALIMGLSDVVLAVNSLRLKWKKVV